MLRHTPSAPAAVGRIGADDGAPRDPLLGWARDHGHQDPDRCGLAIGLAEHPQRGAAQLTGLVLVAQARHLLRGKHVHHVADGERPAVPSAMDHRGQVDLAPLTRIEHAQRLASVEHVELEAGVDLDAPAAMEVQPDAG